MKIFRYVLYLVAIIALAHESVYAQNNVVTIDDCQEWAVAQSSANTQKELNAQLLKVKLNDAAAHLYPTLEINGLATYQSQVPQLPTELGVDKLSKDQYRISLDFSQTIFDGTKAHNKRKYERLLNESEIQKVNLSINTLKENVISIYLGLLIIEKQNNILTNAETALQEQINRLKILLENGVVYSNSIDQLELEALKIAQQKSELNSTKESLISSLSILTGKDLTEATFIVPELPEIEENTNSVRAEYAIFQNQKDALEYQRKLHFSNSLPSAQLFASAGYGRPTYDIFSNKFDWFYIVGVRLNVPIIAWAKTTGVGNIINLQKSIVVSQQSDFEKSNKIAIQEKLNEIKKIKKLIALDEQITDKYKSITNTFSKQLLNGTITAYDFIKHQNDELQSLLAQEVHSFQLLKAKYELLALKGLL